jgi:hypothetical protein
VATLAPISLTDTPLAAGDQWVLDVSLADASQTNGYTAVLYLVGPSLLNVTGVGTGTEWRFTAPSADTAPLPAGRYTAAIKVTKDGEPRTIPALAVTVTPDIAMATSGAFVGHADRMIPLLEAAIEKRVRVDMKEYTITNTAATREDLDTYLKMLDRYRAEVSGRDARASDRLWRSHSAVL